MAVAPVLLLGFRPRSEALNSGYHFKPESRHNFGQGDTGTALTRRLSAPERLRPGAPQFLHRTDHRTGSTCPGGVPLRAVPRLTSRSSAMISTIQELKQKRKWR